MILVSQSFFYTMLGTSLPASFRSEKRVLGSLLLFSGSFLEPLFAAQRLISRVVQVPKYYNLKILDQSSTSRDWIIS